MADNEQTVTTQIESKFSIFDPVITFEHREFYEEIVAGLNGLFPICNQGKCTAVEISEDATEQEQITDLMVRVENFSQELLDVTKKLFDQFYQAKEAFYEMILSTVSYVKINLIDRNLLERTCDVRWWALETAFGDCIEETNRVRDLLRTLADSLSALDPKFEKACEGQDEKNLYRKIWRPMRPQMIDNINIIVKQDAFAQFEERANRLHKLLSGVDEGETVLLLEKVLSSLRTLHPKVQFACERLEDVRSSYTLYRDLIICDKDGFVIANSNHDTREAVLGLCVADEKWFAAAMETKDGNEYFAQDLTTSKVEDQYSLVYTTAIREKSDTNGKVTGAMGIYFDFQGEAAIILDDYMPKTEKGDVEDGWYSFITNEEGVIIGSSDGSMFEPGKLAHVPRRHRSLEKGETCSSYAVIEGQDSVLFTAKTDGYLEYEGLGWSSHLVLPKTGIFDSRYKIEDTGINSDDLMNTLIIPQINKQTYEKIQEDKESIQLISLNGIVFASKLGKRGVALGPIFDQITKTGDFATSRMEYLLAEMAAGELALNLQALEMFSKQAIDLIDRNLFERSADIRWWATDMYFWDALMHPSEEKFQAACNRLKVINNSYTMYRNLVLANTDGDVVACSQLEQRNELKKINVSDQEWFQKGMRTQGSREYAVQDVEDSILEKHRARSLIYCGGIRSSGAREGESIGVLGVFFDWDTEASKILCTCLPKDKNGDYIQGCAAFYTNRKNQIIETSDKEIFPVGATVELPEASSELEPGTSSSGLFTQGDKHYILGSSRTQGYREYEGLDWSAHVVRPLY